MRVFKAATVIAVSLAAAFSVTSISGFAATSLSAYPAPAMTVADCTGGRIWMMGGNGLPTCDFYVPPPPPPPPAASYTYIYSVENTTIRCNGNGCHSLTMIKRTTTSAGNQWAFLWQVEDNTILPWGFDIGPLSASNPITTSATDLRAFMTPFVNAGCLIASDSSDTKNTISNATGINLFANPGAGAPFAGQTLPNANNGNPAAINYALCQTAVM